MWDFARGCIRTYLILREKAQRFHEDAEIQAALETAMVDRLAEPALDVDHARRDRRDAARPARPRSDGDPRLRPRAARPARDRAAARRALSRRSDAPVPLVLGVDSSTQSTKVEVRDADTGELVADGRAPHPPTTPPRSEQDPDAWWEALHAAVEQAGAPARDVGRGARSPASSTGWSCSTRDDRVVRPAKLWNDTESAPDARWLVDQLAGPGRAARRPGQPRAGRCPSPRSRSRSCRGCTAASPTRGRGSRVCACPTTGSRGSSPASS